MEGNRFERELNPAHAPIMMKFAICGLLLCVNLAQAGLRDYPALVVADSNVPALPPRGQIRVTYLGVNGYQLETGKHVLLVDPYFTRIGFWPVTFNQPSASNRDRVGEALPHLRTRVDAVLVTHAHFDHLLDVPAILEHTGARLFSGPTAINLMRSSGVPQSRCETVKPGAVRTIGPWTIRVFPAQHDKLFGSTPFPGRVDTVNPPPGKVSDWVVGEPLAFVIEAAGKRIYVDSGGVPGAAPSAAIGQVDLAILGVALPDSRARYAEAVRSLRPRYILPSHQDDFFSPLRSGFVFGKMTSFPQLLRNQTEEHLPGRVILLDYFRPWTLR